MEALPWMNLLIPAMRYKNLLFILALLPLTFLLLACDPLAPYQPTPVAVVVSPIPSDTPTPAPATPTLAATRTPFPTVTPDYTATPTPFPCEQDSGQIINIRDFPSDVAGGENLRYQVYIPPCYLETQRRFPYVIMLHGLSYKETHWDELGIDEALDQGIRLGVIPPMILVMPYYGTMGQRNSFPPDPSYELVILDELLPAVERNFCTWSDRDHRAIGGISRGGFWAYSIALRHPDIFGSVGGHSAYFPNNTSEIPPAFNPLELALNSSFLEESNLRMYLDNGADDSSGPSQQLFSSRLSSRGITHTYVINPVGEHDNDYWSAHVTEYLSFYGKNWPRHFNELPSCAEPSP
jgi:enterochelin esterase-like enzyme